MIVPDCYVVFITDRKEWWVFDRRIGTTVGFPFYHQRSAEWAAANMVGVRR